MTKEESQIFHNDQKGATLIIAVVILSSVTFLSFALSTIILREIKVAQDLAKTEPAISAASGGSEIGIFNYLRQTGSIQSSIQNLPESGAAYTVSTDFYEFPFIFNLQPADGNANQLGSYTYNYYLYDPENFENSTGLYGTMTIQNTSSGGNITYRVYSFADLENPFQFGFLSPNQTSPTINLSSSDDRYVIGLEWGNYSISGAIKIWDRSGQPKGVPAENPAIESAGTKDTVERRMRVQF